MQSSSMHAPTSPVSCTLGVLEAVVRCAASIARLPAVPALDWCERAARALLPLSTHGTTVVVVADVNETGLITAWHGSSVVRGDRALREGERYVAEPRASTYWIGTSARPEPTARLIIDVDSSSVPAPMHGAARCVACLLKLQGRPADRCLIAYIAQHAGHAMLPACGSVAPLLTQIASLALAERNGEIPWLTKREQQVLDGLVMGLSTRQIAQRFHRSPHTVHDHIKGLHEKLGASSRGQLLARVLGGAFSAVD